MDRINKLCAFLDKCESFADIGCDHGYCTRYMLKNGLCNTAVIADISEKCLEKAQNLLARYIQSGVCRSVCCDGLDGVGVCEQVIIAGMGGEEITAILKRGYIPEKFVLQPMRNTRALREFLLSSGAEITRDTVFTSGGKFYTVIKGVARGNADAYGAKIYSEAELEYGKELTTPAVKEFLISELTKKKEYLSRVPSGRDDKLEREINLINGVLHSGI